MQAPLRFRVAAGIMILFAFAATAAKVVDPDFWWHLRDGETILATHAVPRVDTYSYTMAGMPWVDHEWLPEAGFAWMWNHGLMPALDAIFAIIAFIPFAIWLRRYRTWPELWTIAAGAALFISFIAVKPQVLSYLFFFIVYELLSRYYDDIKDRAGRKRIYLALLPLIFFVWANIHAEFFSGLVLFAVFLIADTAVAWWKNKRFPWNEGNNIFFGFGILLASIITPLFNPYGPGLYGEIFRVALSSNTMKYIQEWQSPFTVQPTFSPQAIAMACMFSVFILLAIRYHKLLSPTRLAAGMLFFIFFAKALRMGPLFVIAAIPLIHEGFAHASAEFSPHWHLVNPRVKKVFKGMSIAASLGALALILAAPTAFAASQYPAGAVDFLDRSAAQGNTIVILNYYSWGGYLIWNAPEIKVFIDGRMPHWIAPDGASAMNDYIDMFLSPTSPSGQEAILAKWNINTILIPSADANPGGANNALIATLRSAGWTITYSDPIATILQRGK
jgi:hypothetical protein